LTSYVYNDLQNTDITKQQPFATISNT